jgi:hypothetical protein
VEIWSPHRDNGDDWRSALSFIKRRLGLPPSSRAIGLDQIPESLPLLATSLLLPLTAVDVTVATALFLCGLCGGLALSYLLFKWHVRDRPF